MSEMELGLPFDIHGGGSDLIFPHHENEIAQSEAATGEAVRSLLAAWRHAADQPGEDEQVARQLPAPQRRAGSYDKNIIRLLMLQTHYRSSLDFSDSRLEETTHAYARLANLVRNLRWARDLAVCGLGVSRRGARGVASGHLGDAREVRCRHGRRLQHGRRAGVGLRTRPCSQHLPRATTRWTCARKTAKYSAKPKTLSSICWACSASQIGEGEKAAYPPAVFELAKSVAGYEGADAQSAVDALLKTRSVARAEKNWELADVVREGLTRLGFHIEDTPQGARVVYNK